MIIFLIKIHPVHFWQTVLNYLECRSQNFTCTSYKVVISVRLLNNFH